MLQQTVQSPTPAQHIIMTIATWHASYSTARHLDIYTYISISVAHAPHYGGTWMNLYIGNTKQAV